MRKRTGRGDPRLITTGVVAMVMTACANEMESGELVLMPDESFVALTVQGNDATPACVQYTLMNQSSRPLDYQRFISVNWVTVSGPDVGVLDGGSEVIVDVCLVQSSVRSMPIGTHSATIEYTDGARAFEIAVELRIDAPAATYSMDLEPTDGIVATGPSGGPFGPPSKTYTWDNRGNGSLSYQCELSEPWIVTSIPLNGSVPAAQSLSFDVSLGPDATLLPSGTHVAEVVLADAESSVVLHTISVELTVAVDQPSPPSGGQVRDGTGPDIDDQESVTTIAANWRNFVAGSSAIASYEWSIGQTIGGSEFQDWVNVGLATHASNNSLNLSIGTTYYASVRARDVAGNVSDTVSSDGVTITGPSPDVTPPLTGSVRDGLGGDIDMQAATDAIAANWSGFSDSESGLAYYEIAIGSSVGSTDVVNWTAVGLVESTEVDSLALQYGGLYFVSVRAYDQAGNVSSVVSSDGVAVSNSVSETVSRHGITWTFDRAYSTGQFANGDPWVVGPVSIVAIDPPSSSADSPHKNGSMVNPVPRFFSNPEHGYDPRLPDVNYVSALNVALDVSLANPLVLQPGSSLVSTISVGSPPSGGRRHIKSAAVLTVVDQAPLPGSFRPPYCGSDKTVRFNKGDLNYSLLRSVPRVANTASLSSVVESLEQVWLDHQGGWIGGALHPVDNMPGYGADIATAISIAALHLHLDYTQAEKEPLAVRFVQLGIDLFGIIDNGGQSNWSPDGGHASGRKWPILFAGLILDDAVMKDIGFRSGVMFGEDAQTFFVEETSPGVFNNGHGGYGSADVGLPEWGIRHATHPQFDDRSWGAPYRQCCTAADWVGIVLAVRMTGAQAAWNHDALFDYQDRYMQINGADVPWVGAMWNAYRPLY